MECPYCNGTGTSNICVNGIFKTCTYCNGTGEVFKCPKCGEFAYLSNWGSLFDHNYAWYNIECEKCGYRADGGTNPQKAKEMFVNGIGNIPKPLTEQEYLQTCNTEQLAEALADVSLWVHPFMQHKNRFELLKKQFYEWLQQPHAKE